MENNRTNLVKSMIEGLIKEKEAHGFKLTNNGQLEDITGRLFEIAIDQDSNEDSYTIKLKLRPYLSRTLFEQLVWVQS